MRIVFIRRDNMFFFVSKDKNKRKENEKKRIRK